MEVKLIDIVIPVKVYLETGHTLKKGAALTNRAGKEMVFEQTLNENQILVVDPTSEKFFTTQVSTALVVTKCVLEEDINFKHIVQRELKFEDK